MSTNENKRPEVDEKEMQAFLTEIGEAMVKAEEDCLKQGASGLEAALGGAIATLSGALFVMSAGMKLLRERVDELEKQLANKANKRGKKERKGEGHEAG